MKPALSSQDLQANFWLSRMQIRAAIHTLLTADNALHLAKAVTCISLVSSAARQRLIIQSFKN